MKPITTRTHNTQHTTHHTNTQSYPITTYTQRASHHTHTHSQSAVTTRQHTQHRHLTWPTCAHRASHCLTDASSAAAPTQAVVMRWHDLLQLAPSATRTAAAACSTELNPKFFIRSDPNIIRIWLQVQIEFRFFPTWLTQNLIGLIWTQICPPLIFCITGSPKAELPE